MKADLSPLQAIKPPTAQYDVAQFTYPGLNNYVDVGYTAEYEAVESHLDEHGLEYWDGVDNEHLYKHLPVIALKIQEASTRQQQEYWSQQLTEVTSRLFGSPEPDEARRLIRGSLGHLLALAKSNNVDWEIVEPLFNCYREVISPEDLKANTGTIESDELLPKIKKILYKRYQPVYDIIDNDFKDDDVLDADTIRSYYGQMLAELASQDNTWRGWKIETGLGPQMSVLPISQVINVGEHLPPLSALRAKSMFTHEVIVHAGRAVRGSIYGHSMAYGLPGYTEAEEGLGVLMEAAIEGKMPYRVADRYIDIALAMGLLGLPAISRPSLFKIARGRLVLRRIDEGMEVDMADIDHIAWQHVNRIYRGSLGNDVVGVMAKDMIYYQGYKNMASYLSRYRDLDLYRAVKFVLSGKMNPTSHRHRSYIHDIKFNVVRDK